MTIPGLGPASLTLLVPAALGWAGRGGVVLHHCVPGEGLVGQLGMGLALLRADEACPSGAVALGTDAHQALVVVVSVALPVLLLHACALLAGVGAALVLRRCAAVLRGTAQRAASAVRAVGRPVRLVVVAPGPSARVGRVVDARPPSALSERAGRVLVIRGPPCAVV